MNAIDTGKYKKWRAKCQKFFSDKYRNPVLDHTKKLIDGFYVTFQSFEGKTRDCNLYLSKNTLFNKDGKEIFVWYNLDSSADFATLFIHSNGMHYIVFRIDLYGYGVYELESGKELYYIPSEAYPDNGDIDETFIWTDADYDPNSNLLAVCGCYWACPTSTIIVDFSNPLTIQPHNSWFDVRNIINLGNENYPHIDLVGWKNGILSLQIEDQSNIVCLNAKELQNKIRKS